MQRRINYILIVNKIKEEVSPLPEDSPLLYFLIKERPNLLFVHYLNDTCCYFCGIVLSYFTSIKESLAISSL